MAPRTAADPPKKMMERRVMKGTAMKKREESPVPTRFLAAARAVRPATPTSSAKTRRDRGDPACPREWRTPA
jgi:hypothetical protein